MSGSAEGTFFACTQIHASGATPSASRMANCSRAAGRRLGAGLYGPDPSQTQPPRKFRP
jgi:hypothetical protein